MTFIPAPQPKAFLQIVNPFTHHRAVYDLEELRKYVLEHCDPAQICSDPLCPTRQSSTMEVEPELILALLDRKPHGYRKE